MHAALDAHIAGRSFEWSEWNDPSGDYRFVMIADHLLIGSDRSAPQTQRDIRDLEQIRLHWNSEVPH